MVSGKSKFLAGRQANFKDFSRKLARVKFLLQEAVNINACQERGFELIYHNPNNYHSKQKRINKFYYYGKEFPAELKKSESDVSEEDFKPKTPHKKLEPPSSKPSNVNPEPIVTGNTWTVSVLLNDLPTAWSDIRIGVDHLKRLIIPQGKFQRTVTRPDGVKIKSSNIWSKEIIVPDIVEMKPSIKFHNNVLKIECDLKPEFRTATTTKNDAEDPLPGGSETSEDFLLHEATYTAEEESLLEAAYENSPHTDPPELVLVKLGATLKTERRHIIEWFKQKRKNEKKKEADEKNTDGTLFENNLTFTAEEEMLLEDAYLNNMNDPKTDMQLDHPPEMILVKLGSTLKKDRHTILDWFQQKKINQNGIEKNKGLLEKFFQKKNFPKKNEIKRICEQTGISERNVWAWFRGRRRKARMANENVVFDLPKVINLNSASSQGPSSSSATHASSETIKIETSPKLDNVYERLATDTEAVKIEVMEDDEEITMLEDDDGIKIEHFSDYEDDQPLTEAQAKEMDS